eukprot:m.356705 g.356705  ORF g.356705 m.356705 type:complete len:106 (-) comp17605_c0_seq1:381-698(-)
MRSIYISSPSLSPLSLSPLPLPLQPSSPLWVFFRLVYDQQSFMSMSVGRANTCRDCVAFFEVTFTVTCTRSLSPFSRRDLNLLIVVQLWSCVSYTPHQPSPLLGL